MNGKQTQTRFTIPGVKPQIFTEGQCSKQIVQMEALNLSNKPTRKQNHCTSNKIYRQMIKKQIC